VLVFFNAVCNLKVATVDNQSGVEPPTFCALMRGLGVAVDAAAESYQGGVRVYTKAREVRYNRRRYGRKPLDYTTLTYFKRRVDVGGYEWLCGIEPTRELYPPVVDLAVELKRLGLDASKEGHAVFKVDTSLQMRSSPSKHGQPPPESPRKRMQKQRSALKSAPPSSTGRTAGALGPEQTSRFRSRTRSKSARPSFDLRAGIDLITPLSKPLTAVPLPKKFKKKKRPTSAPAPITHSTYKRLLAGPSRDRYDRSVQNNVVNHSLVDHWNKGKAAEHVTRDKIERRRFDTARSWDPSSKATWSEVKRLEAFGTSTGGATRLGLNNAGATGRTTGSKGVLTTQPFPHM